MTRTKWFWFCFALILLCALFLVKSIRSVPMTYPPNIPGDWKPHQGGIGIFQVWLPGEWKDVEKGRTGSFLRAVRSGEEYGMITVWNDDSIFEINAPLVGKELARQCSSHYPVSLTLDFEGSIPVDVANVIMIEREDDGIYIAYQSAVLVREADRNLVRTVAFAVSAEHVFMIHLDTTEGINENGSTMHEKILRAFYVTE